MLSDRQARQVVRKQEVGLEPGLPSDLHTEGRQQKLDWERREGNDKEKRN